MLTYALLLLVQAVVPTPVAKPSPKPEPVCVRAGDLPAGFAGWYDAPVAPGIGKPFVVTGGEWQKVKWATGPSARAGKAALVHFTVPKAGNYRVALSSGTWVDVVAGRSLVTSTTHGHGPACTGMRKIVDFTLAAGDHALQLSGMPGDSVKVMIVPAG